MKVSIIVSLFAALTCSISEASPVQDDNKIISRSISSSISRVAFEHHVIRRLSENINNKKKKRNLQETGGNLTDCQLAYVELLNSTTQLKEAAETYFTNYLAIMQGRESILSGCKMTDNGGMDCDLRQTVEGQDEFEAACTAAGGTVVTFDLSIDCQVQIEATGNTTTFAIQITEAVDCAPAGCEDEIEATTGEIQDSFEAGVEAAFQLANFTSVECSVGSDGDETGSGGEEGEPDGNETPNTSGAASVESKTMLSVLIMAVLSIIVPAM
jgi:hypothetical protein